MLEEPELPLLPLSNDSSLAQTDSVSSDLVPPEAHWLSEKPKLPLLPLSHDSSFAQTESIMSDLIPPGTRWLLEEPKLPLLPLSNDSSLAQVGSVKSEADSVASNLIAFAYTEAIESDANDRSVESVMEGSFFFSLA